MIYTIKFEENYLYDKKNNLYKLNRTVLAP